MKSNQILDQNIKKANSYLARFKKSGVLNHINGERVASIDGETFEIISPIDLQPLAQVSRSGFQDVDNATRAAKNAFSEWAKMDGAKRKKLLHSIADEIVKRAEEIAFIESIDTGQSIRFMAKAELRGAENFRYSDDKSV